MIGRASLNTSRTILSIYMLKRIWTSLDNLAYASTIGHEAAWLERYFEEIDVLAAVFDLGGDKGLGSNGILLEVLGGYKRGNHDIYVRVSLKGQASNE